MNIGFDLDDTINNLEEVFTKYAYKYNKENNIDYNIQKDKWGFEESFGWDDFHVENFSKIYLKNVFESAKPKRWAKDTINKLYDQGHNIYIITARSRRYIPDVFNITLKWLDKYNIKNHKLIIEAKDKVDQCLQNNVEIFVDDIVNNCEQLKKRTNIDVYLFHSIFNKEYENDNIPRVYNWKQINKLINK